MNTIAKRIPTDTELKACRRRSELAEAYGLTLDEFNKADLAFLENEGYDSQGNEYDTLHQWLIRGHKQFHDNTPYQKGDEYPQ